MKFQPGSIIDSLNRVIVSPTDYVLVLDGNYGRTITSYWVTNYEIENNTYYDMDKYRHTIDSKTLMLITDIFV